MAGRAESLSPERSEGSQTCADPVLTLAVLVRKRMSVKLDSCR